MTRELYILYTVYVARGVLETRGSFDRGRNARVIARRTCIKRRVRGKRAICLTALETFQTAWVFAWSNDENKRGPGDTPSNRDNIMIMITILITIKTIITIPFRVSVKRPSDDDCYVRKNRHRTNPAALARVRNTLFDFRRETSRRTSYTRTSRENPS